MEDPDYITVPEAREMVACHEGKFSLRSTPLTAEFTMVSGMRALNSIRRTTSYDLRLLLQPLGFFQGHLIRDVDELDPARAEVLRFFFECKKGIRIRTNEFMKRLDMTEPDGVGVKKNLEGMKGTVIGIEFFVYALQTKLERTLYRAYIADKNPSLRRLKYMWQMTRSTKDAADIIFENIDRRLTD